MDATDPPVGRRIKAAMALAGINSFAELAERIDQRGMGERTLRKLADDRDDERPAQRRDLVLIAEATNVPYEFFTRDLWDLALDPHPGRTLASLMQGGDDAQMELGELRPMLESVLSELFTKKFFHFAANAGEISDGERREIQRRFDELEAEIAFMTTVLIGGSAEGVDEAAKERLRGRLEARRTMGLDESEEEPEAGGEGTAERTPGPSRAVTDRRRALAIRRFMAETQEPEDADVD